MKTNRKGIGTGMVGFRGVSVIHVQYIGDLSLSSNEL